MTDLLTVQDAARRLGVSTARVRLLCQQGRIKAQKLGAAATAPWVIRPEALAAFEASRRGNNR